MLHLKKRHFAPILRGAVAKRLRGSDNILREIIVENPTTASGPPPLERGEKGAVLHLKKRNFAPLLRGAVAKRLRGSDNILREIIIENPTTASGPPPLKRGEKGPLLH